jgi:hypothetical protein
VQGTIEAMVRRAADTIRVVPGYSWWRMALHRGF